MRTLSLLITITSGVSIYALAAHFLKAEELRETLELVSRKLAKVKK